jgi:HK97 family phage major capsid protein
LRTIERYHDMGQMPDRAANAMEALSRDPRDPTAQTARYLAAVGDPDYNSAFGKYLMYGETGAPLRWTPEENRAWQRVQQVEAERAALQTGSGPAGGFALPIVIDPSIMLTSNGALNPIRQLARVITINTTEWRGVTSAGVIASYDPELGEVSDDSPTLAQPVILTEKAQAFIEFSIEVGQDWASLQAETFWTPRSSTTAPVPTSPSV